MASKKVAKKKKVWYTVLAPEDYGKQEVGRTLSKDDKSIMGRIIDVSSDELGARSSREQKMKVVLKVNSIKDNKANTFVKEVNVNTTMLSRFMKKNSDKIESSKVYEMADNGKVKVKIVLLTKSRTHRTQRADLKKYLEDNVKRIISKYSYEKLVLDVIQSKFQKLVGQGLNKIIVVKKLVVARIKLV